MSARYERLCAGTQTARGAAFPEIPDVLERLGGPARDVLDAGCGPGRGAPFIAGPGHRVTGVDSAPAGVAMPDAAARAETLAQRASTAGIAGGSRAVKVLKDAKGFPFVRVLSRMREHA